VYVHVPQAGDEILPLAVHDRGPLRHPDLAGLADGSDPVAGDDDRHVRPGRRPSGVDDNDALDGQRFRRRVFSLDRERPGQGDDGQASAYAPHFEQFAQAVEAAAAGAAQRRRVIAHKASVPQSQLKLTPMWHGQL
jgi:hypothetical protein